MEDNRENDTVLDVETPVVQENPTVEVVNPVEEVVSPAEEIVTPVEEVPVEEVATPVEDVVSQTPGYSKMDRVELVAAFNLLLEDEKCTNRVAEVKLIKERYYSLRNEEVKEQRNAFILDGGVEEEFTPQADNREPELKECVQRFNSLYSQIRQARDKSREENLANKLAVIEDMKKLREAEESSSLFSDFKVLQERWKQIGDVPQSESNNLWKTYHHNVELLFDYINLNRELRDLDFKKNLEQKEELIKRATALTESSDILSAFKELQSLHDQWKEVGPVDREIREEVWNRFKQASRVINKLHQDFFEAKKVIEEKNIADKDALCVEAEAIAALDYKVAKEWEAAQKLIIDVQERWKKVGYVRRAEGEKLWNRFRTSNDNFFEKKRLFWSAVKEENAINHKLKVALCEKAEALSESSDWNKTTDELIELQKEWKDVGPVSRKHSDILWKRFRGACDLFFNKRTESRSGDREEEKKNLKVKEQFLDELETLTLNGSAKEDVGVLAVKRQEWKELGHVPRANKDKINDRFRSIMNKHFSNIDANDEEKELLTLQAKIEDMSGSRDGLRELYNERDFIERKLKGIASELQVSQNNIGFFTMSKGGGGLMDKLENSIKRLKSQEKSLKSKLKLIKAAIISAE